MSKSAMTPSFSGRMAWMWAGRAADHPLGLGADGDGAAVLDVDGHDRRLVQHDALAAHVDERVGRAEVDRHVAAHDRGEEEHTLSAIRSGPRGSEPTASTAAPEARSTGLACRSDEAD